MVGMACVMVCGVLLLIASDVIRHKAALRLSSQLDEERSNVLKKVDNVTRNIWDLTNQIEREKTRPKEAQKKEERSALLDMMTVLMERPYTEIKISSGSHYIIASSTPSGQPVLEQFLSQKMTLSEKFQERVPKDIAKLMLESAIEKFRQYSLEGKPEREQLPFGTFHRSVLL